MIQDKHLNIFLMSMYGAGLMEWSKLVNLKKFLSLRNITLIVLIFAKKRQQYDRDLIVPIVMESVYFVKS